MIPRRRTDWLHIIGASIGLVIIGVGLFEHAALGHDTNYTIALLVIGGVLINPLAILSLVGLMRRGEPPANVKCATCGLWLARLNQMPVPPDGPDQP